MITAIKDLPIMQGLTFPKYTEDGITVKLGASSLAEANNFIHQFKNLKVLHKDYRSNSVRFASDNMHVWLEAPASNRILTGEAEFCKWYLEELPEYNPQIKTDADWIYNMIEEPIYSSTYQDYTKQDILYEDQALRKRVKDTIVKPKELFDYSGTRFTPSMYGKVVRIMGKHVLVYWENILPKESYLCDDHHWIVPLSKLLAVEHRDVPTSFNVFDEVVTQGYITTEDKTSVLGKHYYLRLSNDAKQEVIAIDQGSALPYIIDAKTMQFLGTAYMYELCELVDVKIKQRKEPTAYLKHDRW